MNRDEILCDYMYNKKMYILITEYIIYLFFF